MKRHQSLRLLAQLLLMLGCTTGCAGTYQSLPSEDRVAVLCAMKERGAAISERTVMVPFAQTQGKPVRLSVHESGTGSRPRLIVLIHGVLSDSGLWRFVRGDLAGEADVLAIDLPGCGESDRPSPAELGPGGYGPAALARDVLTVLRERLRARSEKPAVTLVGHSLGGLLILRMLDDPQLASDFRDVLGQVDGAVLFSPADVAIEQPIPVFQTIVTSGDVTFTLSAATGILQDRVAAGVRDGVVDPSRGTREEARRLTEILADPARRHAAQAMLSLAIPSHDFTNPDWDQIDRIVARYASIRVPCLIVWGGRDQTLPLSMGYKLADQIPGARLRIIGHAMHCLPTERPECCVRLILQFTRQREDGLPRIASFDEPAGNRPRDRGT